jgi:hypothetical protein
VALTPVEDNVKGLDGGLTGMLTDISALSDLGVRKGQWEQFNDDQREANSGPDHRTGAGLESRFAGKPQIMRGRRP